MIISFTRSHRKQPNVNYQIEFDESDDWHSSDDDTDSDISYSPPQKKKEPKNTRRSFAINDQPQQLAQETEGLNPTGTADESRLGSSSSSSSSSSDEAQPSTSTGRGKNKFKCTICEYRSGSKSQIKNHMTNSHTGARPYECKECSKTFLSRKNLRNHHKIHLPPEFKCDFCPKMFTYKHHRDIHTNTHTGAKPFECEHCHKRLNSRWNLAQHQKKHSAPKYECPFCHKMFHQSGSCKTDWNGSKNKGIACLVRLQQGI